jgi:hypothetical protein
MRIGCSSLDGRINRHQIKQYEKQKKYALIEQSSPYLSRTWLREAKTEQRMTYLWLLPLPPSSNSVHARIPALPPEEGRQATASSAPIASAFLNPSSRESEEQYWI